MLAAARICSRRSAAGIRSGLFSITVDMLSADYYADPCNHSITTMTPLPRGIPMSALSTARRVPIWLAILAASLPMFMATLDNLVVTNALPVIGKDMSASIEELQWIVNAYSLSFASLMLMAVALGDRLGRRTLFLVGIAVF